MPLCMWDQNVGVHIHTFTPLLLIVDEVLQRREAAGGRRGRSSLPQWQEGVEGAGG
jgi:hypothetical protein